MTDTGCDAARGEHPGAVAGLSPAALAFTVHRLYREDGQAAAADAVFAAVARAWLAGRAAAQGEHPGAVAALTPAEVAVAVDRLYPGGLTAARAQLATAPAEPPRRPGLESAARAVIARIDRCLAADDSDDPQYHDPRTTLEEVDWLLRSALPEDDDYAPVGATADLIDADYDGTAAPGVSVTAAARTAAPAAPGVDVPGPDGDPAAVAAYLRTLATVDDGRAYLAGLRLDRAALVAVAAALGITRTGSLRTHRALTDRVLSQAIGARRKFDGLRRW
jgi:hypothetical protein